MSRALARLREATGDPLLVRAGRGLVPTPGRSNSAAGQSARAGGKTVLSPAESQPPTTRPNVHAADPRRLCWRLRPGPYRSRQRGGSRSAAALRAEAGQRQRAASRRGRRSGNSVVGRRLVRRCVHRHCFRDRFIGVVRMGAPAEPGRSLPPVMRPAGTSGSRREARQDRLMSLNPFGLNGRSLRSSAAFSNRAGSSSGLRPDRQCSRGHTRKPARRNA